MKVLFCVGGRGFAEAKRQAREAEEGYLGSSQWILRPEWTITTRWRPTSTGTGMNWNLVLKGHLQNLPTCYLFFLFFFFFLSSFIILFVFITLFIHISVLASKYSLYFKYFTGYNKILIMYTLPVIQYCFIFLSPNTRT